MRMDPAQKQPRTEGIGQGAVLMSNCCFCRYFAEAKDMWDETYHYCKENGEIIEDPNYMAPCPFFEPYKKKEASE